MENYFKRNIIDGCITYDQVNNIDAKELLARTWRKSCELNEYDIMYISQMVPVHKVKLLDYFRSYAVSMEYESIFIKNIQ